MTVDLGVIVVVVSALCCFLTAELAISLRAASIFSTSLPDLLIEVKFSKISYAKSANSYRSHHISGLIQLKIAGIAGLADLNSCK